MKSLREYIIIEKLHLNKDINTGKTIKIDIPKLDSEARLIKDEIWKSFEFDDKQFVIYKDHYRNNDAHFSFLGDMVMTMVWTGESDWEDFNPSKDILYQSNDLTDAFKWYCDYLGIDYKVFKHLDPDDIQAEFENVTFKHKTCDSSNFFVNMLSGEWDEDDLYIGLEDLKDIDKLDNNFPEIADKLYS